jgi:hypothetical protein
MISSLRERDKVYRLMNIERCKMAFKRVEPASSSILPVDTQKKVGV